MNFALFTCPYRIQSVGMAQSKIKEITKEPKSLE
mgnify:CR=1 FL=1